MSFGDDTLTGETLFHLRPEDRDKFPVKQTGKPDDWCFVHNQRIGVCFDAGLPHVFRGFAPMKENFTFGFEGRRADYGSAKDYAEPELITRMSPKSSFDHIRITFDDSDDQQSGQFLRNYYPRRFTRPASVFKRFVLPVIVAAGGYFLFFWARSVLQRRSGGSDGSR